MGEVIVNELPQLSRREREVMDIVHESGAATAAQIRERMAEPPTYSAVRSVLRILVNKGHLASEQDGARNLYSPTVPASRARRSAMRHVLRTFFGGSVEGAVATLLELDETKLTPEERARIQALIDEASREGR
ncbi:MAG: BlaI/MecI/CopY family transcriptional regulator [Holophagales bacterium]|nr:BlaI/MecI/CopY family transcriptional regulator [Holophagales bacterium]MYF94571.1 BlaI/MecI/CopY family transcriptional regulator [Holophagales bacterium]